MLTNLREKIKPFLDDLILGAIIVSVALIGFGLGRLSKLEERSVPITVEKMGAFAGLTSGAGEDGVADALTANKPEGTLVVSKNGTKYHYLWCPGASTIKEENKVYFATKEEAEKAGYGPAANCKGL